MTLQNTIKSYLYVQYNDDDNIQALVDAQNNLAQQYLDWANQINLPIYTSGTITGSLLDWVAQGVYGLPRPSLPVGRLSQVGPLNTYALNSIAFNARRVLSTDGLPGGIGTFSIGQTPIGGIGNPNFYATSDDTYKRILTWLFFKGDGRVFSVRWLKRRIMRFLTGPNGVDPGVSQTYQVSVSFGVGNQVNIRLITVVRTLTGGALFNRFTMNGSAFNAFRTTAQNLPAIPNAAVLKSAIDSGVLELPFQFTYVVIV